MSVFPGGIAEDRTEVLIAQAVAAERERCAQTARRIGANLDEPTVGNAIAEAIIKNKD